jgi:hypothetical protein
MQDMIATLRSAALAMLFGTVTVCAAIGCAENNSASKKPASTGVAVAATETPKKEAAPVKTTEAEDAAEAKEILATRAKLSPEDKTLVDAQEWCVINNEERLGGSAMGGPIKLMIKGEPVFICCKSCKKEAEADPEKTLAKVKELKEKKKAEVSKK